MNRTTRGRIGRGLSPGIGHQMGAVAKHWALSAAPYVNEGGPGKTPAAAEKKKKKHFEIGHNQGRSAFGK